MIIYTRAARSFPERADVGLHSNQTTPEFTESQTKLAKQMESIQLLIH